MARRGQSLASDVAIKQTTLDDLFRQVSRLIGVSNAVVERYATSFEEINANRLAIEEIRELLSDHFYETARWVDRLDKTLRELQRYIILIRATGGNNETIEIESKFSKSQIESALREELVNQQELVIQYQKNIDRVKIKIAKFGESTALANEADDYQKEINKSMEAIGRIRATLA